MIVPAKKCDFNKEGSVYCHMTKNGWMSWVQNWVLTMGHGNMETISDPKTRRFIKVIHKDSS